MQGAAKADRTLALAGCWGDMGQEVDQSRRKRARAGERRRAAASSSCSTPRARSRTACSRLDRAQSPRGQRRHRVRRGVDPRRRAGRRQRRSTRASKPASPPTTTRCSRRCASSGCRPARRHARRATLRPARPSATRATPVGCASAGWLRRAPGSLPHRRRRAGAALRAARTLAPRRGHRRGADDSASPTSSRARRRSPSSAPSAGCAARATRCRASSARTSSRARPSAAASRASRAELGRSEKQRRPRGRALSARDRRRRTAPTSSTSSRTSSAASTRAATTRRSATTAPQLEQHLRPRPAPPGRVPADPQVEPRPPGPAVRAARERAAAEPHRRRHQHELLPDRPAGAPQRRLLHPPHLQGQPGLQVRPAALHRLPDREALLARVVHRGRPLALRQAAAAALRDARLRRRRLPARQERRRAVLIPVSIAYDQIQDVGDYVAEQRGAAKETRELRLVPPRHPPAAPPLRRHPHPLRRAALARRGARRADPRRRAEPRRAEPRGAEARLRGLPSASTASRRSRRPRW